MAVYWFMLAMPILGMVFPSHRFGRLNSGLWVLTGLIFLFIVGLRNEVGWDWANYAIHLRGLHYHSLFEAMAATDPGYAGLAWIGERLHLGLYFVNCACAALLLIGLMSFARRQPDPWLSLLVALPYAIIVVGMGYTRQSAAIGLEFMALQALLDRRLLRFALCVVGAALFHKAAAVLLPLAILYSDRSLLLRASLAAITALAVFGLSHLAQGFDILSERYLSGRLVSEGANTRLAINALAAVAFLLLRRFIAATPGERTLLMAMAVVSLAFLPLGLFFSTAVDRLALFLVPLQMLVWGRIALIFAKPAWGQMVRVGVVTLYVSIQFVWLNYATHAGAWVPYHNLFWR